MTTAGDLKHRITFAKRDVTDDGMGNEVAEWTDQFTVQASLQARFGGESILAARLGGVQTYLIVVRQSEQTRQIGVDWRATDARSRLELAIKTIVDPLDDHAYFEMLCQSGVAP